MAIVSVKSGIPSTPPVKLLDPVRDRIRYKHDSIRTEHSYVHERRHHTHEQALQRAIKQAVVNGGYRQTCHHTQLAPLLRHAFVAIRL
jgi:hypothetical protein